MMRHKTTGSADDSRTEKRQKANKRYRLYCFSSVVVGLLLLLVLVSTIVSNGVSAFQQTFVTIEVFLDPSKLDKNDKRRVEDLKKVMTFAYQPMVQEALFDKVGALNIATTLDRSADMKAILSDEAAVSIRKQVISDPSLIGRTVTFTVLVSSRVDGYLKGRVSRDSIKRDKRISSAHLDLVDALRTAGLIKKSFNWDFITGTDASDKRPEAAGIGTAVLGSLYMMLVVMSLSLSIGVMAAIYLEEFAPKNWVTRLIEVNITTLAGIPSIVYGILGLTAFIQVANLPQSVPLVGGLTLTLMTLPTIVITARASLKAVPITVRRAALSLGASKRQVVCHHVLPGAAPGILTGSVIGIAQALGETAPLLLIGMVGFVASEHPESFMSGFTTPNSAMPAQIYEWAKRADPAFYERAWGGIIILLVFLMGVSAIAILLRRHFEKRQ